jgi:hypothetical protein
MKRIFRPTHHELKNAAVTLAAKTPKRLYLLMTIQSQSIKKGCSGFINEISSMDAVTIIMTTFFDC